jgi:hypothetical protein
VRTFEGLANSDDPRVSVPAKEILPELGGLILATRSPGNDRDGRASGDSLRDLVETLTLGTAIDDISPSATAILADERVRPDLVDHVGQWQADGHLDDIDRELSWMVSVDVDGDTLGSGEPTGLHALIRLLHDTNQPMHCSFDLWVTNLDVDLGNMAVTILDTLAGADPDTLRSGIGILGGILDWNISQSILDDVADSGVCPVLTSQVVHDLRAIDLIQHDEMNDTLAVFLDALAVLKGRGGNESRIPELADLATGLEDANVVWSLEEVLRDVDGEPAVGTIVELVPVLIDPGAYGVRAGDEPAADLDDMLGLMVWVFEDGDDGRTGWERSRDLLRPVVREEGTWRAVGAFAGVVTQDGSSTAGLFDLLGPTLAADPDLVTLDQLGPLLREESLARPVLRILETPAVIDSAFATDPVDGEDPPIGFIGRLIADGTVDEALRTIDIVVDAFDGLVTTSSDSDVPE